MKEYLVLVGRVLLVSLLITILTGCNLLSLNTPEVNPPATQITDAMAPSLAITPISTLQPLFTFTPPNTRTPIPFVETTSSPEPGGTASPHQIIPNEPGNAEGVIQDVRSEIWANLNQVESGDDYNTNLYERPFTQKAMVYTGEVDIKRAEITSDANFFYVSIEVNNLDQTTNTLNGAYAVELDVDKDGRGEFIIWTFFPTSKNWTTNSVSVFIDTNNDVGHLLPLKSEAPWKDGNGYDNEIFSPKYYTDPDMAWSRISPSNPRIVQIAFKRSIAVFKAFLWGVWADKELHNSFQMDYNDHYTLEEAGSPYDNNEYFPIRLLHSLDNTCRAPYGFKPTFKEPGICPPDKMASSTPPIKPTSDLLSTQIVPVKPTTPVALATFVIPIKPTDTQPAPPLSPGIISGCVYGDYDANGVRDGSDSNWTYGGVSIDISGSAVSIGSDGCFSYTIDVGDYIVTLRHAGYNSSTPDSYSLGIGPGEVRTLFFGLVPPG
jgi:hypothetical protein